MRRRFRLNGTTARITNPLLQPRVLGLGLLQDGDVEIGVFPEGKKFRCTDAFHGVIGSVADRR